MKYVPSLPPRITEAGTGLRVNPLTGIKRANPVKARTLPPLVVQPQVPHETPPEDEKKVEKRHDPHLHGERRTYCRRTEHLPILVELRSGKDRRQHSQRMGDTAEHIDVEA